ncbi:MAG TPA: heterodisulfide reductase-related iron-sulfur binding cluster [Candidatus Binatia bacterium]|nr:heterodisulfide reductase-related iron-sulfur binding cluster [Candidatus Binatia bacterium]
MRFADPARLAACVHCGLCLAACPTYLELGTEADSPRGRIHLLRALEEKRLKPTAEVRRHLDLCLGCRACETACPSGVEYGTLIEAARPVLERHRPAPARLARRALAAVLVRRGPRALVFAPARAVGGARWLAALARRLRSPLLASVSALPRGARRRLPAVSEPEGRPRGTALLVTGCVADTLFPATNAATAALLRLAGVRVLAPRAQGCCGALALHLGAARAAQAAAARLVALAADPAIDWVVTNAAGCGALVREYGRLLPGAPRAAAVAAKGRDALALLGALGLPPPRCPRPCTVAVHDPCHLAHAQGVRAEVRDLLAAVPGVRLVPLAESEVCCGSAGTYNLTERVMAARLLARKLDHVAASGADVVAAANPGCLLQIRAGALVRGLPVSVEHPIDLLAAAHGVG